MIHQRREMVKKEEMIAKGKTSRLQRESGRERVPMNSLELITLSWMQYLKQHKFYAINCLRELPKFHLYLSLNCAKLAWTL
jgi:hypothetical protein